MVTFLENPAGDGGGAAETEELQLGAMKAQDKILDKLGFITQVHSQQKEIQNLEQVKVFSIILDSGLNKLFSFSRE